MNLKRLFLVLFGVVALIVLGLAYRREILAAITFISSRPYRQLPDEELDIRIAETEAELAMINKNLQGLSSRLSDPSIGDHAALRDLREQAKKPIAAYDNLLAEQQWRHHRMNYLFIVGFIVSALVFLETFRQMLLSRNPQQRKRQTLRKQLDQEIAAERAARLAPGPGAEARKALDFSRADPRLALLVPGISTRQDVINSLGQPSERTIFLELEAWTYYLPDPAKAKPDRGPAPKPEDEVWGTLDQEFKNSKTDQDLMPVTIIFKNNVVHDLSIGVIKDRKDMRRIL